MDIAALTGHELTNASEVSSPALLIYPARIKENIQGMLALVGNDASRLRPHVKTHKLGAIVRMQLDAGISKFKCATIAEAEMVADAGARDVLLAYQMVGPNTLRVGKLARSFPQTRFSVLVDELEAAKVLSAAVVAANVTVGVFVDIDCGMHRSGIEPSDGARQLYRNLFSLPGLEVRGLHAYDGHIHDASEAVRHSRNHEAMAGVDAFREQLVSDGHPAPEIVAGGTPTFPMLAQRQGIECSPGTCLLNDAGYGTSYPDMDFLPAAYLLTRVISKPGANRICLDLGHKAVAAENPITNRVRFPSLPDAVPVSQSEEHLVLETDRADELDLGDTLYALPWHVCPTVALYSEAVVVSELGAANERWPILARSRSITI